MRHKLAMSVTLATIMAFGVGASPTAASADDADERRGAEPSTAKVVSIRVPKFSGEIALSVDGLVELSAESRTTAPSSFAVDGDRVYLHDPLNEAIVVFEHGKPAGVAAEGLAHSALDLLSHAGKLYVLANDNQVLTFADADSKGRLREIGQSVVMRHSSSADRNSDGFDAIDIAQVPADGLTVVNDEVFATFDDNTQVSITAKAAYPTLELTVDDDSYRIAGFVGGKEVALAAFAEPSGIFESARDEDFVYFEVAESHFVSDGAEIFDYYVYQFTHSGTHVATYALAPMLDVVPNRHVLVSDGGVFQLHIDGTNTRILKLSPSREWTSIQAAVLETATAADTGTTAAKAKKIKYSDLVEGVALANLKWTYKRDNNGWDEDGKHPKVTSTKVSQPRPLRGVKAGGKKSVVGVPYNWGGYDSSTTSSVPKSYSTFADGVSKKYFTGNIDNDGGRKAGTIGLDCSGFVSVIYKLGKKYTTKTGASTNLATVFNLVNRKPKGGEIRMKNGHVFEVAARRKKGNTWRVVVMESTTRDSYDRVIHQDRAESSYDNAFKTYVYPNFDYQCDIRDCNE